ncbi:hypothetical protein GUITHDRAFT_149034 [Guillardia theta CCMP2712]|uniref:Uncharacterized protein n=1 Tax=Guillardia theta (strain CCMP2712) TaxID=905079 RepID=L1I700_GUITC|nr:hypothetical protein GUITHDRAFT_149034 [Guillardia theta CCMP2712]EKX31832.1 hypothetical protein GUITHDRAFT_149034 [Guillardia theta CCMP2712]|eukprot:XP_005818812.1 hypothetical protein GUITHDRAFT_149034 [Guillardia theta CCMP2712]
MLSVIFGWIRALLLSAQAWWSAFLPAALTQEAQHCLYDAKPQQTLRSSDASPPPLDRHGLGRKACPLPQPPQRTSPPLFARSPSSPRRKSCPSIDASSSASSFGRTPSSSSLSVKPRLSSGSRFYANIVRTEQGSSASVRRHSFHGGQQASEVRAARREQAGPGRSPKAETIGRMPSCPEGTGREESLTGTLMIRRSPSSGGPGQERCGTMEGEGRMRRMSEGCAGRTPGVSRMKGGRDGSKVR